MKKISILLSSILLVGYFNVANAKIVFDPKNFAKNLVTSATALKLEVQEVTQTIQQMKQLQTMYDNLKTINPTQLAAQQLGISENLKTYTEYKSALESVNSALGDQSSWLDNVKSNYAASGTGKFEDYIGVLQKRADSGNKNAQYLVGLADSTSKNVENSVKRRNELQKQIASSSGILQSSQTTNQYLDQIVSQNSDITSLLALNARELAEKKQIEALNAESQKERDIKAKSDGKLAVDSFQDRWNLPNK